MGGETILSFAIGRLRDLLVQELVYLQALRGPVDELAEKLTKMEELLEYAHIRRDKCTAEIIELADHLTDSVETYVLRVMSKRIGLRERLLRPKVHLGIEKITTKIDDLLNSQIGVQFNIEDARRPYKVQDLSGFNEKDFVGREEDVDKLVSYLVDEDDEQFQVISIHGMGGLGKTTLARKVYKDKKVLRHFQCFAFVCVSEQCQSEYVLKHILQQLVRGKNDEITTMPMEDVIDWLHKVQRDRKCLIIMDDIWSIPDWESLKRGIPNEWTGSKVVLTTRMKDVADKGFCYSLKFLSEDECWELFEKKILTGPGEAYGEELKGIMNQVNLDLLQHSSLEIILDNPKIDIGKLPQICEGILHKVTVEGMRGKVRNLLSQFSNFGQLASLSLLDVEFEEDPMPTLEKLLNLRDLGLLSGEVKGKEMGCSTMGFPQLRSLYLRQLKNWEKWRVEEGAMLNIRRIYILVNARS